MQLTFSTPYSSNRHFKYLLLKMTLLNLVKVWLILELTPAGGEYSPNWRCKQFENLPTKFSLYLKLDRNK